MTKRADFIAIQVGADGRFLRSVEVQIVDRKKCKEIYERNKDKITPRVICAAVPEGGKDSCNGDSGGALVLKKSGKHVGILPWGAGCESKIFPGVYTNTAHKTMQDFIESELKQVATDSFPNDSEV